jgi:hypothetical protein
MVVVVEKNMCFFLRVENTNFALPRIRGWRVSKSLGHIPRELRHPILLIIPTYIRRHTAMMPPRSMITTVLSISQRNAAVLSGSVLYAEG